jgi:hypothetical protein
LKTPYLSSAGHAVWRILSYEDRRARAELRETLKALRPRLYPPIHNDEEQGRGSQPEGPVTGSDLVDDGSVPGRPLTAEEETVCRATPVGVLGLSARARNIANARGFVTALDIAKANREELAHSKNCGRTTIREFRLAVVKALEDRGPAIIVDAGRVEDLKEQILGMLSKLDPRSQLVLQKRFGLWDGDRRTLEDVAGTLGLTRERIRQIETKAITALRGSFSSTLANGLIAQLRDFYLDAARSPSFAGVLTADDVETIVELRVSAHGTEATTRALAVRFLIGAFDDDLEEFKRGLTADGEHRWFRTQASAKRFQSIESAVRTLLASRGQPIHSNDLLKRLYAIDLETNAAELERLSVVSSEIGLSAGAPALRHWNRFRRGRAVVRIERALAELGQPTHHSYIAEKLNFMFPDKAPFVGHAIIATMLRYPDVFVSPGRGTYALRNWGVSRPPLVKNFVIESLKRAGGQATIEQVAELGAKKHGFKQSSIAMTMALHPTFFKRIRGTLYKLL